MLSTLTLLGTRQSPGPLHTVRGCRENARHFVSDPSFYHRPLALDSIRTEAVAIHDFTSGMINDFMTQLALTETVVVATLQSHTWSRCGRPF